jgi:DNA repair exonuclease SbcCD nuclease subunit
MKLAIINDTHCGIKNGSDVFLDNAESFYKNVFFPYLEEHDIDTILHLGDYYDHRRFVNFKALERNRHMFLDVIRDKGIHMYIVPGNHDVYYKNTNDLCSLKELLGHYTDCVKIYMEPTDLQIEDGSIGLVPWICPENEKECMDFIQNTKSQILMGHFELAGFKFMANTNIKSHGMGTEIFNRFDSVYSGHYHTKSSQSNVTYLGTQMELTWSDAHDPKYFHVFDTETREMTPIRNPYTLFRKLYYSDDEQSDYSDISGKYVKIIVSEKTNAYEFDKYVDRVQALNPADLKIVENFGDLSAETIQDEEINLEDTQTLLNTYVDAIESKLSKRKLKTILNELHTEALEIESI